MSSPLQAGRPAPPHAHPDSDHRRGRPAAVAGRPLPGPGPAPSRSPSPSARRLRVVLGVGGDAAACFFRLRGPGAWWRGVSGERIRCPARAMLAEPAGTNF